jgi:hypothetical protein
MRTLLSILIATTWVSLNEFIRNDLFLGDHWHVHFAQLGIDFPNEPVNGAIWGLWSLCFVSALNFLLQRWSVLSAAAVGWMFGFPLMWIVVGNLGVLPEGVLPYAVPWSMFEAVVAVWIMSRLRVHGTTVVDEEKLKK